MASSIAPATHCVHRWAHNEDPNKTGRTGSVRYDGMSLYHHATVIAVKYPKQNVVVLAMGGIWNSASTKSQKCRALNALPLQWRAIYVDCDQHGHELESMAGLRRCSDAMRADLKRRAETVKAARRGASLALAYEAWNSQLKNCAELSEFLNRRPEAAEDYFNASELAEIRIYAARREAARRDKWAGDTKAWLKAETKRAEAEAEDAELWRRRDYKGNRTYWSGTYVRLSRDGAHIETSKGVVVPFEDALRLFRLCAVARKRATAVPYILESANTPQIGGYLLSSITDTGDCVVGCHRLSFDEMERCFKEAESRRLVPEQEGAISQ